MQIERKPSIDDLMAMSPQKRLAAMLEHGVTEADYGMSKRAMGINPRALGSNPRARTARRNPR